MKLNGGRCSTRSIRRRNSPRTSARPRSSSTPVSSNAERWLRRQDPRLERKARGERRQRHEAVGLHDDSPPGPPLLQDDVAPDAALLHLVVLGGALQLLRDHDRDDRGGDELGVRVLERGTGGGAVVLEDEDVGEARVLLEVEHPLAIGEPGRRPPPRSAAWPAWPRGRASRSRPRERPRRSCGRRAPRRRAPARPRCGEPGTCWAPPAYDQPGPLASESGLRLARISGGVFVLVVRAEDAVAALGLHRLPGKVGRPPAALGGDDDPSPDHGILPAAQARRSPTRASSRVAARPSSEASASSGDLPSNSTAATSAAIGSATPCRARQRQCRGDGRHALGHHARGPLGLDTRLAARQRHAEGAVARQGPRGRQHEVAEPGQTGQRRRLSAKRHRQSRDLGQPARHQPRPRVLAETEPVGEPRRQRDHVLESPPRPRHRRRRGWCRAGTRASRGAAAGRRPARRHARR